MNMDSGARKRAKFWLGDRANMGDIETNLDDDEQMVISEPGDDEVDVEPPIDVRSPNFPYIVISDDEEDEMMDDDSVAEALERRKEAVRAMSQEVVDSMEI